MSDDIKNTDDRLNPIPSSKGLVDIPPEYDVTDRTVRVALYNEDKSLNSTGYYDSNRKRVVGLVDDPQAVVKHRAIDSFITDADGDGIRDLRTVLKDQILDGFNYPSVRLIEQFPIGAN